MIVVFPPDRRRNAPVAGTCRSPVLLGIALLVALGLSFRGGAAEGPSASEAKKPALEAPAATAPARELPAPDQVIEKLRLANAYFMQKWPDPGQVIVTDRPRPSHIWTRGVYYEGLMALYGIDRDPRYYDYAVRWGEAHAWGLRGGPRSRSADDQCCGQTYLDLYQIDPRPERIRDLQTSIDAVVAGPGNSDWWWIDALQMAMPVYARFGVLTKDPKYCEKMYELFEYTKSRQGTRGLYNPADHLWWRDRDFLPPYREPNGADCYWSRGNGWVVAALVRVLDVLPADAPHRAEYVRTFQDMAAALLPLQRSDGFWNVSLHDPNHFGGKELSGTALFAYGYAWGIRHGLLPAARYRPALVQAWNAMVAEAMHPTGQLGYVQGTGKEPKDRQPVTFDKIPDFEDFGLGCFLLAGSEVYKLARETKPVDR